MTWMSCEDERMLLTHWLSPDSIIIGDKGTGSATDGKKLHGSKKYFAYYSKLTKIQERWMHKKGRHSAARFKIHT